MANSQLKIWGFIAETPKIQIIGGFLFRVRVRKALRAVQKEHEFFTKSFPARFIRSSQRLHFDRDLCVLYLDNSFNGQKFKEIIFVLLNNGSLESVITTPKNRIGAINNFYRKRIRVSIETRIENAAVKIAKTPPRGKVATEDQHFLMMIMRLKMFVKKITRKIESQSIIFLLEKNRKIHQKRLRKNHRQHIDSFEDINAQHEQEIIAEIDSLIHEKRLLLQRRLISRTLLGIEKWQSMSVLSDIPQKNADKLKSIDKEIKQFSKRIIQNKHPLFSVFPGLWEVFHKRKLINLKRKKVKYNYFSHIAGKQQEFMDKLRHYFQEYYHSSLIPNSFMESINLRYFNLLRLAINLIFIGFYVYLINIPLFYAPIFLALGMFVFQPISNKFAVLFMVPFVKTGGQKRLSYGELNSAINERAGRGKYLCAIDLPLFTGQSAELETTVHYINRNLRNLRDTLTYYKSLGVIYQITSNTADAKIINQEIDLINRAQAYADELHGKNRVYFLYLHRKSSVAKKVGNIVAAHLLKFHGITDAEIYIDSGKFLTTFNQGPLFDHVYGNFADSLCAMNHPQAEVQLNNQDIINEIISGNKIPISRKIDFTFFVDNKNEIKSSSLEKGLAIMLHPENSNICILQPEMSIEDPIHEDKKLTSAFLRMMRIARDTHNFRYLKTLHGIYQGMSAYYGKGMIRLTGYDYMVMNEVLNLGYVDSHDWQESVFNYAVFCSGSDKRVSVKHISDKRINLLIESENESNMYRLLFDNDSCVINDKEGNQRAVRLTPGSEQDRILQVVNFLENNMVVGERELISTIGNYIRDARWLKGDLQMFNTFYPYAKYLPAYHKFHLRNIFRRFSNELALLIWVVVNFFVLSILTTPVLRGSQAIFFLSLHLAVTAFGFAGIDLFLYPISYEVKNNIHGLSRNYLKSILSSIIKVIKKIWVGLWQFPLYLLIAWPRILLGVNTSIQTILAGIDQPVNWSTASNASISAEEVSEAGIPFKKFMRSYRIIIGVGVFLWISLLFFIAQRYASSSILSILNMGTIIISLIVGPFVSYAISRKIEVN